MLPHRCSRSLATMLAAALLFGAGVAALAAVAPSETPPAAADGNEAPNAPGAFRAITGGDSFTCAIVSSVGVKCWGLNSSGQLGQGSTTNLGDQPGEMAALPPINLGAGRTANAISAGNSHACALLDNGTVKCWGANASGQLGQDSTANQGDNAGEMAALPAVNLGAGRTATAISAGTSFTCAILDNGTVKCWGLNASGQLGQGTTANQGDNAGEMTSLQPVNLGVGRTATAISAGISHACALLDDGTVKCWGLNASGQLGQGTTANQGDNAGEMASLLPVNLGVGRTATAISAGDSHTCALLDDRTVKCWGYNGHGELGQDSTANQGDQLGEMAILPAVSLGAGRTATAVAAGNYHSCARLDDGSVKCWGQGTDGRLGQDSTATLGDQAGEMAALPAVNLGSGRTATAITAGGYHTCATLDDGSLKCWGFGASGQLGQGSTANLGDQPGEMASLPAVDLSGVRLVAIRTADRTSVAVGDQIRVTLSVTNGGAVDLTNITISDPTATGCEVAPFSLAPGANKTVRCTHTAAAGDIPTYDATASVDSDQTTPVTSNPLRVAVATRSAYRQVAGGGSHTCAIVIDGRVKCWGASTSGQLGLGTQTVRGDGAGEMGNNLPFVDLGTGRTATAIAAGSNHTCALLDNGAVKCWGSNSSGQLGLGDTNSRGDNAGEMGDNLPAVDLGTGRTATAIAAGSNHTCAVLDNGAVKCWGSNSSGQLGLGDTNSRGDNAGEMGDNLPAVDLGTGRTATATSAAASVSCVLLDNGAVKCWGLNSVGQLGLGDINSRGDNAGEMGDNLPAVDLGTARTATAIATGGLHSCAVLDNGSLKCWGFSSQGQLGQGSTSTRGDGPGEMGDNLAATNLGTGRTALAVVAAVPSCALLDNGTVKCWGTNSQGQLGQGDTTGRGTTSGTMGDNLPAVDLGTGRTATTISMGTNHTCARLDDGTVKCWGLNSSGQLGQGDTNHRGDASGEMGDNLPAIDLGSPALTAVRIASESYVRTGTAIHLTMVITNVGISDLTNVTITDPSATGCQVAPFSLAIGMTRTVRCTHTAAAGDAPTYTGAGATVDADEISPVPTNAVSVQVRPASSYRTIVTGPDHSCAILDGGVVKCWGEGSYGQLGLGDINTRGDGTGEMADNLPAVDLGTGRSATALALGENFTCALLDDATVKCWGQGDVGELGRGNANSVGYGPNHMGDNLPAIDLGTGRTAVAITAGSLHACALLDNGTVKCWGLNNFGQLGQGTTSNRGDDPNEMGDNLAITNLGSGRTALAISAGSVHTCALLDDGNVRCWGQNNFGQLGLGDVNPRGDGAGEMGDSLPVVNLGAGRTVVTLVSGGEHSCALLDDQTLKCWGRGSSGQLGHGAVTALGDGANEMGNALPVVNLGTGRTVRTLSAGDSHNCAILDNGTLKCWGSNSGGQLGQGTALNRGDGAGEMGDSLAVTDLGTGRTATVITAGLSAQSCALLDNRTFKCWGYNTRGQLGQGNTAFRGAAAGEMGDALPVVDLGTIVVQKWADETSVVSGSTLHLHVRVLNISAATALTGVVVIDAEAPGCASTIGNLAASTASLTIDCTDVPTASQAPTYVNIATGDSDQGPAVASNQLRVLVAAQGIGGTLRESPSGDLLPGAWVLALRSSDYTLAGASVTAAGGTWFVDLPPGSYRLEFLEPSLSHGIEWYDGVPYDQPASSQIVTVNAGAALTANADLPLPTSTLRGTITEQGTGTTLGGQWVAALDTAGRVVASTVTAANGSYTLAGLDPGTYRVASTDPAGGHATRMAPSATDFGAATAVVATAGVTATADVTVPTASATAATTTITGTITDDVTGQGVPGTWVVALKTSDFSFAGGALTDANGQYSIAVPTGDYYLRYFDDENHYQSEWSGGQNLPTSTSGLAVVPGGGTASEGLAPLRGSIAGHVTAEQGGAPIAGAWVAVIGASTGQPVAGMVADANGAFHFDWLRLGDYHIVFVDPTGAHRVEYNGDTPGPTGATPVTVTASHTTTTNAALANAAAS